MLAFSASLRAIAGTALRLAWIVQVYAGRGGTAENSDKILCNSEVLRLNGFGSVATTNYPQVTTRTCSTTLIIGRLQTLKMTVVEIKQYNCNNLLSKWIGTFSGSFCKGAGCPSFCFIDVNDKRSPVCSLAEGTSYSFNGSVRIKLPYSEIGCTIRLQYGVSVRSESPGIIKNLTTAMGGMSNVSFNLSSVSTEMPVPWDACSECSVAELNDGNRKAVAINCTHATVTCLFGSSFDQTSASVITECDANEGVWKTYPQCKARCLLENLTTEVQMADFLNLTHAFVQCLPGYYYKSWTVVSTVVECDPNKSTWSFVPKCEGCSVHELFVSSQHDFQISLTNATNAIVTYSSQKDHMPVCKVMAKCNDVTKNWTVIGPCEVIGNDAASSASSTPSVLLYTGLPVATVVVLALTLVIALACRRARKTVALQSSKKHSGDEAHVNQVGEAAYELAANYPRHGQQDIDAAYEDADLHSTEELVLHDNPVYA